MDWSDTNNVLQAIFWAMAVFMPFHGYSQGNRL